MDDAAGPYPAPWALEGECLVALVPRPGPGQVPGLPEGLQPLPGWDLAMAASYTTSPVGPYLELALGTPARQGPRLGLCVTTMVVTSAASRLWGRRNWGYPKELGTLTWTVDGACRSLRWEERAFEVAGEARGPALPVWAPVRSLQQRDDGLVLVPGRLRASARPGLVTIRPREGDPLAALGGSRPGAVLSGLRLLVDPARP